MEVIITDTAHEDAEMYAEFISQKSNDSKASDLWWNGLVDAILSLETFPLRCPLIKEEAGSELQVRQLLYESHRILFRIDGKRVCIIRIYPTWGRPLRSLRQRLEDAKGKLNRRL